MTNKRPKVAILSTWNEICGIAHFTKGIKENLEETCDVEVLPTPRMILGNAKDGAEKEAAENYCKYLARRVGEFDHVNIQFEPGILAGDMATAMRRFKIITKHAKSLSITWHYIARRKSTAPSEILRLVFQGKVRYAAALMRSEAVLNSNWNTLFNYIRLRGRTIRISHIVHTKRDAHLVNALFNHDAFSKRGEGRRHQPVSATPLTYLSDSQKSVFTKKLAQSELKNVMPKQTTKATRYIGVFGFFSGYKGFETAIDAVDSLPPEYELLMFSSVHESTLRIESRRDEYLGKLYDHINKRDKSIRSRNAEKAKEKIKLLTKMEAKGAKPTPASTKLLDKAFEKKKALSERVHFLGAVSDDDLILGMMLCDAVLFPYINSPHTASGPTAQAIELDRRVFASRNIQFVELAKFHENHFEFCDIGNSIEYAQKIPRMTKDRTDKIIHGYRVVDYPVQEREHNMATAIEIYKRAVAHR